MDLSCCSSATRRRLSYMIPLVLAGLVLAGCASTAAAKRKAKPAVKKPPLRTVAHVDLERYMGDWRVIANIPYFAEKGCVDSVESYRLRPDGKIDNWFSYRKRSFSAPRQKMEGMVAEVLDKQTNAYWKVKFFSGLVQVKYMILELDPEYQWVVVGHPSRKYGWIMARQKTLPDSTYQAILRKLAAQGYDPNQFQKVPQVP